MAERSGHSEVRVGPQGRIVIPAALRRLLGIEPGQTMVARVEGQQLIFESRAAALARLRARVGALGKDADLVDELLEERRRDARREAER
jgi:AbrB family looped-hinge helix DNA binding protein